MEAYCLKNTWYIAAWTDEVLENAVFARTICDEPVALMRDANGVARALEDRCAHRGLPLSQGQVINGQVRCRYHGAEFDGCTGKCSRIPGQATIPAAAKVRTYPVVEQDRAVWIWMGDPERADPSGIPRFELHREPGWACRPTHQLIRADHQLISDNLMDLTHVGFVHVGTLGGDPEHHANANLKVDRTPHGVRVTRIMQDTVPGPFHVRQGGFKGRVDRWQIIEYRPGVVYIDSGMTDAGQGGPFELRDGVFNLRKVLYNGITPETAHSSHYFWSMAHQVGADRPEYVEGFFREVAATFAEDLDIIEAQYQRRRDLPGRPTFDRVSDAGGIQSRRLLARLMSEEQEVSRNAA